MEKEFIDYHAAMLIDKLFQASSTPKYMESDLGGRVDLLSDSVTEYCSVFEINKDDFKHLKGEIQMFCFYLFDGEKKEKQ